MVSTWRKRLPPPSNATKNSINSNENEGGGAAITCKGKKGAIDVPVSARYEELREQRIKENKERMQKLGIFELSLKLNSKVKTTRNLEKPPSSHNLPLSAPPRRSSRLKTMTPINYKATKTKRGASMDLEIRLGEGSKPEIYTEEHEKLLGDCKTAWTLFVDGYKDGNRKQCHQCRQKTLWRHTHCSKCNLVQGQFCGDCLYMRYGENLIEVDKNPNWICPVCRGICNCSLCRNARGWARTGPAGPIYREVLNLGFKSVAHYLIQIKRKQIQPDDSGVACLDSEGRELAPIDKGSQLATHSESLDGDEHQGTFHGFPSDDNEFEMEVEQKKEYHSDSSEHFDFNYGYDVGNGHNSAENGNEMKETKENMGGGDSNDSDNELKKTKKT